MGGAVDSVANVAKVLAAPIYTPYTAAAGAVKAASGGTNVVSGVASGFKPVIQGASGTMSAIMSGVMDPQAAANAQPSPQGPSAADLQKQQQDAARQAAVNLKNDRPGRSQTILSDTSAYPYRLV